MISFEIENEIVVRRKRDKWPVGTISRFVRVHRDAVRRVLHKHGLLQDGIQSVENPVRASITDSFIPFIEETLFEYPDICASRVFHMLRERGYKGKSESLIRVVVRKLRPTKQKEAFYRLSMVPGEQAQVDWGDFGKVEIGKTTRRLCAFVMTLSYSRLIFLRYFLGMRMREFKQGHIEAFNFFNGVTSTVLHDNLKTGVSERVGKIIRFNDQFLEFASHYGFNPRAAGVRKGNEKGRVERSIGYVRTGFFEGRKWTSLADLNAQALAWCVGQSAERKWPQDRTIHVSSAYEVEKPSLQPLPANPYPCWERVQVSIGKTPYARFDGNDYSVPAQFVGTILEVTANEKTVFIFEQGNPQTAIAEHERCYDKQKTIEDPKHIELIARTKRDGSRHAGLHRLTNEVDGAEEFVTQLALRGENLGGAVVSLLRMLDTFGAKTLSAAIKEVVESGSCTLRAIHFVLRRIERTSIATDLYSPPLACEKHANLTVKHHDTNVYDELTGITK